MLADQKDEHKTQEERDMEKYAVIEDENSIWMNIGKI